MDWVRIIHAKRIDGLKLSIIFNDGVNGEFDFSPIADGGVLLHLHDPVFFNQFNIVRNGRALEWPGGIDFCADALHADILNVKYITQPNLLSATDK